jgi:hypothetical protein
MILVLPLTTEVGVVIHLSPVYSPSTFNYILIRNFFFLLKFMTRLIDLISNSVKLSAKVLVVLFIKH